MTTEVSSYYPPMYSYNHKVVCYKLLTGKKKTLVSNLNANWMGKMTSKYIYYTLGTSSQATKYYRYDIAAKKSVQISQNDYKSK